eukprot:767172-Hanusia_phi.AAC.1
MHALVDVAPPLSAAPRVTTSRVRAASCPPLVELAVSYGGGRRPVDVSFGSGRAGLYLGLLSQFRGKLAFCVRKVIAFLTCTDVIQGKQRGVERGGE